MFAGALAYQFVVKGMRNKAYRFALGLAIATALVLIWANFVAAVGEDDGSGANLAHFLYFGVPVVGFVGAAIARLRARGMALALAVTAMAQLLVLLIALVFLNARIVVQGGAIPAIGLNGLFIVLFAISALLFRRAARATAS